MLEALQEFLNHYTDEVKIECIANNRIASLKREDILSIQNINDIISVSFDDYMEELPDTQKVAFNTIKITSDINIFKD